MESKKGRILFTIGDIDTLNDFSGELMRDFTILGYEVFTFDVGNMLESLGSLEEIVKEPVVAIITFNNLCYNLELVKGQNTWETLGIPIIDILMDHPFCYKKAMDNAPSNMIVLCPDKNHMRYLNRFHPHISITGYLPHAGKIPSTAIKPIKERSIEVLYTGAISKNQIELTKPDFSEFTFDAERICESAIEDLINNPFKTTEDAIENALISAGITMSDKMLSEFITKCRFVDMSAVSYYRELVIKTLVLSGIDVTIYGGGWERFEWINYDNVHYYGRIPADEIVDKMLDAKIVLNTMTWFKDGTHDRVFNGMLAGAVAVTDTSVYMRETFDDSQMIMFELNDIESLPLTIKTLLLDDNRMQQIADTGRRCALRDHTWMARARELEADLFSIL